MINAPVHFNQLGILCSLGCGAETVFNRLTNPTQQLLAFSDRYSSKRHLPLGLVDTELPSLLGYPAVEQTRTNQLLRAAYLQIETTLSAMMANVSPHRVAVVIGTSTSGIDQSEKAIERYHQQEPIAPDYSYQQQNLANPATALARWAGAKGPSYCISTACTSGAKALASGRRLLRSGLFDIVIAGGVDALCKLTINGFAALDAVSESNCQPFSRNREGINIGEGAALFIMSRIKSKVALAGVGETSDAHHISAPAPTGEGARMAMHKALENAGKSSNAIDYLNLHGTATQQNDAMEAAAVSQVFKHPPPCSSTKSITGHTLGAAGALEAAFCYLAMSNDKGLRPVHHFDGDYDTNLPPLQLVAPQQTASPINLTMSNSFAFGGNNISLVLERHG